MYLQNRLRDELKYKVLALVLVFLELVILLGLSYATVRDQDSITILILFIAAFICYLLAGKLSAFTQNQLIVIGVLSQMTMVFSEPSLSDDFYRFIWDGRLLREGINPYLFLPTEIIANPKFQIGFQELFEHLNSPTYYTVYPGICQLIFLLSTYFGNNNLIIEIISMKVILAAFNIGSLIWLTKLFKLYKIKVSRLYFFVLNPLLLIESIGNMHFEGVMIFFLLWFVHWYKTGKLYYAAVPLAMAISTKLIPLIFLPYILFKDFKKGVIFIIIVSCVCVILFIPLFSMDLIEHLQSSVLLFIKNFEFNASFYFLARAIGYWFTGYNEIALIGPAFGLTVFVSILILSSLAHKRYNIPIELMMVIAMTIHLLLSTTVHPWYILPLFTTSLLTRLNYSLCWTGLVFVSYMGYHEGGYNISPIWLVIEYVLLLTMILYEWYNKKSVFFGDNDTCNNV